MIAGDPGQGGAAWAVLQYVLGFQRLGNDVYFVEPVQARALRPTKAPLAATVNASYFLEVMHAFGLRDRSALLLAGTRETVGLPYDELRRRAHCADLLLNLSGLCAEEALISRIPVRAYLDLDPAFTQLWQAVQGIDMRLGGHTHFVTVGQAIGRPGCDVPTCGLSWLKTLPPIVLERWPVAEAIAHDALTTVGNWRGYGSIEQGGVKYGQRAHSFRQFFELPQCTQERLAPALAIHPDEARDLDALARHGWHLLDPLEVADTPGRYQQFVQQSKAELGIAKSGYVISRCGWFSDRSVCYLASGRPVIAQETGFSDYLPTGEGLFAFTHREEVLEAIESLNGRYAMHAGRARALAEEFFDSDKVLARLLREVGNR
jgi:hypothetical protein